MAKATKRIEYVGLTLELDAIEAAKLFGLLRDLPNRDSVLEDLYTVLLSILCRGEAYGAKSR